MKIHISIDIDEFADKTSVDVNSSGDEFSTLTALAYCIDSIINHHNLDTQITVDIISSLILDLNKYGKVVFDAKDYQELKSVPHSDIDELVDDTFDQNWINQG